MRPRPAARIAGIRRRARSCGPKRLASKIARRAPRGRSSTAPGMAWAPLLKSASIRPPVRSNASAAPAATLSSEA